MKLASILINGDQKTYNIWCRRSSAINLMNAKEKNQIKLIVTIPNLILTRRL
jgi:hypothetical protein